MWRVDLKIKRPLSPSSSQEGGLWITFSKRLLPSKKYFSFFFFLFFLFSSTAVAKYQRIVSLKPNITEIIFSLGKGEQLVGVTKYCIRPAEAKNITRVADYTHANIEKILRLQPDLIFASRENSSKKEIQFLIDQGLKVEILKFSTITQMLQSIEKMGTILNVTGLAEKRVHQIQTQLKTLKQKATTETLQSVLFVVGSEPLIVAGGGTFFEEASSYLGVKNIARQSRLKYPTYTLERLLRSQPEIIIEMTMGTENQNATQKERLAWWQQFESLPAVKNKRVLFFDIEKMRAAPDLPLALKELFELIHPKN